MSKKTILIVVLALILINIVYAQNYVPGEIIVGFESDLTKIDAENLANSHNLEINDWSPPYFTYAKIRVLEGNREDYISLLEDHERIGKVVEVEESNDELLIYFYISDFKNLKLEEVNSIVNEFDNMELVHDKISLSNEIYYLILQANFKVRISINSHNKKGQ